MHACMHEGETHRLNKKGTAKGRIAKKDCDA